MTIEDEELFEVPISEENRIPRFLLIVYVVLIVGGVWAFIVYWNGSSGFLDRGYWKPLQQAADTTYPFEKREGYLDEQKVLKIGE